MQYVHAQVVSLEGKSDALVKVLCALSRRRRLMLCVEDGNPSRTPSECHNIRTVYRVRLPLCVEDTPLADRPSQFSCHPPRP